MPVLQALDEPGQLVEAAHFGGALGAVHPGALSAEAALSLENLDSYKN